VADGASISSVNGADEAPLGLRGRIAGNEAALGAFDFGVNG